MIFSRGKIRKLPKFEFKEETVDAFGDYKYLGVKFNYLIGQRVLKFRLSNHRLPIQQRRSLGIPRDERIWTIYDNGEVGDAFHYLLNCSNENVKRNRIEHVHKSQRAQILRPYEHDLKI